MLIGILADTHIPYRISTIPNGVLDAFKDVDLILHGGDVDEPWALQPLENIAPVYAVSGNYHILDRSSGGKQFPSIQKLTLCGFNIVMTHGHRTGWSTLFWRVYTLVLIILGKVDSSWRDIFISKNLMHRFPEADIYIFGHTHRYFSQYFNDKLVINPGAACAASYFTVMSETTVALLRLKPGQTPQVKRVELHGKRSKPFQS